MYAKDINIILASNSPRRKELIGGLSIPFQVHVIKGIDESFPASLPACEVAEYIAAKKVAPYKDWFHDEHAVPENVVINDNTLIITADTVVVAEGRILGKPSDRDDAYNMLRTISGKTHQVYTGVCILSKDKQKHFSVCTDVTFKDLTDEEIYHYIDNYHPFDKAGAYGIQEWIGYIGVTNLNGSYFNVMGLPVQRIYSEITDW